MNHRVADDDTTLRIGELTIDNPLVFAPIAGYSDLPFRRMARRHGAGFVVTELVSVEGIVRNNKKTMDLLAFHEEERPMGIQIFGRNPETMAEAAKRVEDLGPDFIDINMGCPATKVCKGGEGAGSALLRDPSLAGAIVTEVVKAVSLPVTAKIRIGWNEGERNYNEIIPALEDGGVSLIAIHGRTKVQGYTGLADWDAIEEAAALATVPVVGNGDILTHEQAMERLKGSNCRGIMIGRGACGNPWIFTGHNPSPKEVFDQVMEHLEMSLEHYGPWGLVLMRKHMAKYIHGFRNASSIRHRLMTTEDPKEVADILGEILL